MFGESSENRWIVSDADSRQLDKDILKTVNKPQPNQIANVSLVLDLKFSRNLPSTALISSGRIEKQLNYSLMHDCHTGQQLRKFSEMDCTIGKFNPDGSLKNVSIEFA